MSSENHKPTIPAKGKVEEEAPPADGSNKRRGFKRPALKTPKFDGRCDELRGHIYDCSDYRSADMFTKTTKEIAEHVGRTYRYGGDARIAVENMQAPTFQQPADIDDNAGRTATRI